MSKEIGKTATPGQTELSAALSGLSMTERARLGVLKDDIMGTMHEAEATLNRARINVGHKLNEVRAIIPNDNNFGIWARWNTPFDSSSVWNPLMHLATAEKNGIVTD